MKTSVRPPGYYSRHYKRRAYAVAKRYRRIKFTWNTTTIEIDVPVDNESVSREELSTTRQTIDGSRYRFVTGSSEVYTYSFSFVVDEVFDFFYQAYTQGLTTDITMARELDDGTFTSEPVIVQQPQWRDETIGEDEKVYGDLTVVVVSA